ncbi:MAG: Inosine-5'-monophosphate dehydrogenase [Candidatus Methanoperedens nitroreducens]|uniref:Inosine-5'-monophosphate dehydrogenase n=1 Tax=Candidatus Methanoperedens nitratireducens TaxID=1392998 RepID=A0A0P8CAA0_9EURY|nr:CBS domain-containing protein [Candidatus Methanoperedens sp. BLZ2]KAB2945352.1 MAG: CBS domain-containing protein [Candidatus Methanoperedens sp.]KPQ43716.1 MAG: Inosine-5'-monophosphate dehydrogenase [Candidatus Methanoperedens sp. BLZ1]MBZ0177328.1 CBS domain-containing protein [Candidatus Methanoperedens nitroreducens]MCX9077756.1 CBS domain-containing protein [Candidatus Methanoperedens sp.]
MPNTPHTIKVDDVMVRDVARAELPGSRDEVLEILKSKHISGVPIVKGSELVGIVTRTDLLKHPEEEQIALLMTRNPITITPDKSIVDAARIILNNKIRRLPVVEDSVLTGLITIADIVGAIGRLNITSPISDHIGNGVVSVWSETPLCVVGEIMEIADVKAVPILDSALTLVGVASDKDLISASIIDDKTEMSNMSAGSDDDAWTWESMRDTMSLYYSVSKIQLPNSPVKKIIKLTGEPETALLSSSVSECARKMRRHRIDQLPVVTNTKKLLGLVRDKDLLKAIV